MHRKQNKTFYSAFAILLCTMLLVMAFPLTIFAKEETTTKKPQLQFRKNGQFKILVLSDLQDTNTPQKETTELAERAIEKTEPDFIVLLGDNTAGWWKGVDKAQTKEAIDIVCKRIDDKHIPFAFVYGNHDHEGLCDEENGMQEE